MTEDEKLLETALKNMPYNFIREVLVKPLPNKMVTKTFQKLVETDKKDQDNVGLSETEEVTEEVPSDFREGVLLTECPDSTVWANASNIPKKGDIVLYLERGVKEFDLFKDSVIMLPYSIIAFRSPKENVA